MGSISLGKWGVTTPVTSLDFSDVLFTRLTVHGISKLSQLRDYTLADFCAKVLKYDEALLTEFKGRLQEEPVCCVDLLDAARYISDLVEEPDCSLILSDLYSLGGYHSEERVWVTWDVLHSVLSGRLGKYAYSHIVGVLDKVLVVHQFARSLLARNDASVQCFDICGVRVPIGGTLWVRNFRNSVCEPMRLVSVGTNYVMLRKEGLSLSSGTYRMSFDDLNDSVYPSRAALSLDSAFSDS